jgi:hypothetical protein
MDPTLETILAGVVIRAPNEIEFDGQTIRTASAGASELTVEALQRLSSLIYQFGVMGYRTGRQATPTSPAQASAFLAGLMAANATQARWDSGWSVIEALPTGQVIAGKGGLTRLLHPGEFATFAAPGSVIVKNTPLSVYVPRDIAGAGQGFCFSFGETVGDFQDDACLARFYWNVRPDWAPSLIGAITARLNAFRVPFRMKCLSEPGAYPRHDAAVLYVPRRMAGTVARLLVEPYSRIAPGLLPETPMLTRRLAPGVAFAHDPGNNESFGTHRARLIAEAISLAFAVRQHSPLERLAELHRHLGRNGIDPARPHLGPGGRLHDDVPPLAL